ncbi:MAG TPA: molecular chaperone HtpG [Saprospiraceae bacterium]|nr:molecular chaperone HtpG [Saprospiraceae bacterium]HMP14030.1 molecular chaperone HtpG [Saprospiraceae bacterium]
MQKGTISVQTENIFPIIKKYLYSDQEIFLRELVSNAVDATTKLKVLSLRGEVQGELGDLTIEILLDKENKTLTIRDKGIGMTEEEANKYLNQVAFSSASEFLEKYKNDTGNIIGHFGLGFYSAFMVADKVEAITKSYQETAPGVTWSCDGSPEYTIESNEKMTRGTDIVLRISDDAKEYLEEHRIEALLQKYCRFLPVPVQFGMKTEHVTTTDDENQEPQTVEVPNIINNTEPIWKKQPTELSDEDYQQFYEELYPFSQKPMFWIHLNIDYPFNLTGVLYFPKLNNGFELQKNKIQLYSNQVYVTDDVKDIVPEFLMLLHGVIDSPDIPLNVSRSYLQSDQHVKKITGYITRKVADKLSELFKKDRSAYEAKWPDLSVFVKYGIISDEKFQERALDFALLKNVDGQYFTIEAYKEKVKPAQTDKYDKIVFLYTNQPEIQDAYIQACRKKEYDVLLLDHVIDTHFIQQLEYKLGNVTFVRVDSDTTDNLIQKDEKQESVLSESESESVKSAFEAVAENNTVLLKPMSPEDHPVVITRPEFMRRFKEMQAISGGQWGSDFPDTLQVVVNTNHPLIAQRLAAETDAAKQQDLSRYLYHLALLNQGMLKGAELTAFVNKSLRMMG